MFVPWVVAAYLLCAWTTGGRRGPATGLAGAGVVSAVVGVWWWVSNWVRVGEPAPTTENLTRPIGEGPGGSADLWRYALNFLGDIVTRTWGWVGFRTPKIEMPTAVAVLLTVGVGMAVAVAARHAARGLGPSTGPRRWDLALALLPVGLTLAFVARRAWGIYTSTGIYAFVQGRYLFGAIVAPMAVVAFGAAAALGRRAVPVVLAVAAGVQAGMLTKVVAGSWSGDGGLGPLAGALAWSPWPPALVVVTALVAAACAVAMAIDSHPATAPGDRGARFGRVADRGAGWAGHARPWRTRVPPAAAATIEAPRPRPSITDDTSTCSPGDRGATRV